MENAFHAFQLLVKDQFTPSFKEIYDQPEDWSSMQSMLVVNAIDEAYDVLISHEELARVKELEELYTLLKTKLAASGHS
jgi:acyl carrier protein